MDLQDKENGGQHRDDRLSDTSPEDEAQRKRLFSVVFGVGFAGFVIGGLFLYNSINAPFARVSNSNATDSLAISQDIVNELKNTDTDKDDLSDYDELFTNNTSPYLKDSDGDGASDGDEVKNGANPNCPEGRTCSIVAGTNGNSNSGGSPQIAALRQALKESGAPASVIDAMSDDELYRQYQSAISGSVASANGNSNVNAGSVDVGTLGASEVRSLLEANGIDAATLNTVDDATLMSIYQEAISNINQ